LFSVIFNPWRSILMICGGLVPVRMDPPAKNSV
jgi:hypothetical protein